ncbi:DUF3823 domain-containing protein [Chitinophaga japonensis]|uniref:Uncharacterized protein DUF3823 n=1 Tax=Chitinophaga japonensis TaxID=104662 RepID=A0A562SYZ9_CHIJA|nr:DUF3823 domain-containing protein [Chitinophaga japonensis]TWI86393.1 uncharacterized protein DUF3823 [Chitinophaga japonensis]
MQSRYHHTSYFLLLISCFLLSGGCKKDNYDPPAAQLTGRIVYNGEPVNVEYNQVSYQLYQFGFGKVGPIEGTFNQEGVYSQVLFNGEYKFIIPNGQGPFRWKQTGAGAPDSVTINIQGNQTLDMEVTPYYLIRSPQLTAGNNKVTATCSIEQIITDASARDLESVSLYVNKTQFVSGADNIESATLSAADIADPDNVTLQVTVPAMTPAQDYVYARIGLKIAGVEDRIFSPLVRLDL